MKRNLKLAGLMLIVILTATSCHFAHRKIGAMFAHSRMERFNRTMIMGHRNMGFHRPMEGMGNYWYERNRGMRGGMGMGPMSGIGRGIRPMGSFNMGSEGMMERIPNLSEDQRKQFADLRVKQMQEMDKFREETFAKLQSIRESNRNSMMNLLTDDQKKILESDHRGNNSEPLPEEK